MERGKVPRSVSCPEVSRNSQLISGLSPWDLFTLWLFSVLYNAACQEFPLSPLDVFGVLLGLNAPPVSQ